MKQCLAFLKVFTINVKKYILGLKCLVAPRSLKRAAKACGFSRSLYHCLHSHRDGWMNRTGLLRLLFHAYSSSFSLAGLQAALFLAGWLSIFRWLPVNRHLLGKNKRKKKTKQKGEETALPFAYCRASLQPVTSGISAASNLGKIKRIWSSVI